MHLTPNPKLFALLTFIVPFYSFGTPLAPSLIVETDGIELTLQWNPVSGANGYKLYFAPSPYTGPESVQSLDLGSATEVSGELWLGAAYYLAISAYDDSGESEISTASLVEFTENQMLEDYLQNSTIQSEEWNRYEEVLSQISPYYEGFPSPFLNIDSKWFTSLQIPLEWFSTRTDFFQIETSPLDGVGVGSYFNKPDGSTLVTYSHWVPEEPNAGSAYVLEYVSDVPNELIHKAIEGSTNSWPLRNSDGTTTIAFMGVDEGKLSLEGEEALSPTYFFNVEDKTWLESEYLTASHHSIAVDIDKDGDDDVVSQGWGDGNFLLLNEEGVYQKMNIGGSGSTVAPLGEQADDSYAVFIGDARNDEEYGIEPRSNTIRYYDDLVLGIISDIRQAPDAYFENESFAPVQNYFGSETTTGISHEVYSIAEDIDYDGDKDLVIGSMVWSDENPYAIPQILINEDGEFIDETDIRIFNWNMSAGGMHKIDLTDVNGDGYVDILVTDHGFPWKFHNWTIDGKYLSSARVLFNDGSGHFITAIHQQINHEEKEGPGSQFLPSHVAWLNQNSQLRWSVIKAETNSNEPDNSVDVYTRYLDRSLSTGPNGIDPSKYGAEGFNEFYYLLHNDDVANLVLDGTYVSGFAHYLDTGRAEGRAGNAREATN